MLNTRQNYHHSKLPKLGTIAKNPFTGDRLIVESFPLCDNVLPYSIGIHTVNCRLLKNSKPVKLSGFYLIDNEF